MAILVIGLSHHSAPVTVREKFAFVESTLPAALTQLRQSGIAEEAVVLSTCNRVELYVSTSLDNAEGCRAVRRFLLDWHKQTEGFESELYQLNEPHSVEHLFKVACGLDSMVLGETEILGQLKKAYDLALQHKHTGPRLNRAFQRAFNVAKLIRTDTNIQRGSVSVSSVAVELAEKIFDTLKERQVMVVGAGDTSEKAARALLSRGAHSVIVANRTYDRALALANDLGGKAIHWDAWAQECSNIDIIISSTAATHYIITPAKLEPVMKSRKGRPLLLIDIAVPRDIDPDVNFLENVYLYNIDNLQAIADDYLRLRKEEISHCEEIIRAKAAEALRSGPPSEQPPPRPAFGHK